MQKSILKSKIFWAAIIPMIVDIANLLVGSPIFPEQYRGLLSMASGILIILFRYYSTATITKINPEQDNNIEPDVPEQINN